MDNLAALQGTHVLVIGVAVINIDACGSLKTKKKKKLSGYHLDSNNNASVGLANPDTNLNVTFSLL